MASSAYNASGSGRAPRPTIAALSVSMSSEPSWPIKAPSSPSPAAARCNGSAARAKLVSSANEISVFSSL
jgi:hypothetical protein